MKIDLTEPTTLFDEFINNENNSRILFSAKFGMGKTYFLKEFFKNKTDYETFHLYPINYQVCQNEDIFELIKFDILLKLIDKRWITSDEKINNNLAMQSFLINGGVDFISPIIKMIPKIRTIVEGMEKIFDFFNEYVKYVNKLNNTSINLLEEFGKNFTNGKGSIYEQDSITNTIIDSISNNKETKKTVLIVDDLDRIDPEHVFRILNIFSAHFDLDTKNENKFGFDKIIIVCDIDNIKKIFHAKYGESTDFEGYIDKFYSHSCFHFSNQQTVLKKIDDLFSTNINKYIIRDYLMNIINDFIKCNILSMRDLEKIEKSKFNIKPFYFKYANENLYSGYFNFFTVFGLLEILFGNNFNKLKNAFITCSELLDYNEVSRHIEEIIILCFPFNEIKLKVINFLTEPSLDLRFNFIVDKFDSPLNKFIYKATNYKISLNSEKTILHSKEIYILLLIAYNNYRNTFKDFD